MLAAEPSINESSADTLLYQSTGVSPLRVLTVISLAFALGSALLAGLLLDNSVHVGAGSITWEERMVWAGGLLVSFFGFFVAVWMYERRVVSSIVLLEDGKRLRVETPTLFGMAEHEIPVDDLITSQYHDGDLSGQEATSPPWLWVKVRGHSSFVVPLSGQIPDKEQLLTVLSATR